MGGKFEKLREMGTLESVSLYFISVSNKTWMGGP